MEQTASAEPEPDPILSASQKLPEQAGLNLQAISWSETPERRIAVINGRILKEGEQIEGYSILQIRTDDVVFMQAGQRWMLGFTGR